MDPLIKITRYNNYINRYNQRTELISNFPHVFYREKKPSDDNLHKYDGDKNENENENGDDKEEHK
tara:strand:- start:287 stop:481 length:195 start_codon:yes stop_codon:yes gene_type:complete